MFRFLSRVHRLLVDEAPQRGVLFRIKKVFSKGRRYNQVLRMHGELLNILRVIEVSDYNLLFLEGNKQNSKRTSLYQKDENTNVLTSLSTALDCPYQ